jgi:hypothetical protein
MRLPLLRLVFVLLMASLVAGCEPGALVGVEGRSPECADNPEPEMCEQALDAVVAELGERAAGGRIRIDPVQCAHGRCWTWAYLTPADHGREQQLAVDWLPSGEVSIRYVVQH